MKTRERLWFAFACLAVAGAIGVHKADAINPQDSGTPGWISGLNLSYEDATHVAVSAGGCRDDRDRVNLRLSSAYSLPFSSALAAGSVGVDTKGMSGTAAMSGTGVTGTSTSFLDPTEWNGRVLDGTATIAGISTTVTGTGTKWVTGSASSPPLAINDLIGNATAGYRRVTAILSDTSLTVATTFTLSGSTLYAIENPTLRLGATTTVRVLRITSNTALVSDDSATVAAGASLTLGYAPNVTDDLTNARHFSAWILAGGDWGASTPLCLSTQRTTLYNVGHFSSRRRIGWVRSIPADIGSFLKGNLAPFTQRGNGLDRTMTTASANGATEDLLSSTNGNVPHGIPAPTAFVIVNAGRAVPPGVRRFHAFFGLSGPVASFAYVTAFCDPAMYPSGTSSASAPGALDFASANTGGFPPDSDTWLGHTAEMTCDKAGRTQGAVAPDGTATYGVEVVDYVDDLTP